MFRELAQILLSIQLSAPGLPAVRQLSLAKHIQTRAESTQVDPFDVVAIITHESGFNEHAVSKDEMDWGLMQVRKMYYGDRPTYLLVGEFNINAGTHIMKKSIEFCRNKLKREPTRQEWLSVYHGSTPSCKPTDLTKIFEDYATCLENVVVNHKDINCRKIYWPHGR